MRVSPNEVLGASKLAIQPRILDKIAKYRGLFRMPYSAVLDLRNVVLINEFFLASLKDFTSNEPSLAFYFGGALYIFSVKPIASNTHADNMDKMNVLKTFLIRIVMTAEKEIRDKPDFF